MKLSGINEDSDEILVEKFQDFFEEKMIIFSPYPSYLQGFLLENVGKLLRKVFSNVLRC